MKLVANRVPDSVPPAADGEDPFAAFASETAPAVVPEKAPRWSWPTVRWPWSARTTRRAAIAALSLLVVISAGILAVREIPAGWFTAAPGRLTVTSTPAAAEVWIDGQQRGVTPVTLQLGTGPHKLILRHAGVSREIAITSKPNVEIVQAVDLAPAAPTAGSLSVTSEPSGLRVSVDGSARGSTPIVIAGLSPGQHAVTLAGKNTTTDRSVVVQAGSTAALMVSLPAEPAGAGVGSLTISSPIDIQLFQGDTLVGSSRSARLFLPAGSHTLTAVNDALGYKRAITVDVKAGGASKISIPIPDGALSVNAQPWAEVFVDGKSLGETPIGNYALPIGSHELVFKHPQFGERRQTVVIGVGRTARVGVDLRK